MDVNPEACGCTLETCRGHGVGPSVDALCADLLGPLRPRLDGAVDVLLFNPPYVPTPAEEVERGGIAAAWAGGERGRVVIDRVLPQVPHLLSPGGRMYMVALRENAPGELLAWGRELGLESEVVLERRADEEFLCVIRYVRPA